MAWNATRILWDDQIFLMLILLPAVFIVCGFLALAAPFLVRTTSEEKTSDKKAALGQAFADTR